MIDRAHALSLVSVSRETVARFDIYVDLLRRWQAVKNLVAPSTLDTAWTRHIADSAQLAVLAPTARHWVDLGSGAGFPGLVLAVQLAEEPNALVTLIESDRRKCAFMNTVIRETGARAIVVADRIESALPRLDAKSIHAVTARALAPLPELIGHAERLLMEGAVGIFPKGRGVERELTAVTALRKFAVDLAPSRTDPEGRIAVVRRLDEQDD